MIFSHVLYQLSYLGIPAGAESGAYRGGPPSLSRALREKTGTGFSLLEQAAIQLIATYSTPSSAGGPGLL
ncbi:MAG: hypothetical protein QOH81_1673 [Sphingomonadales bacterium]|nr:hypothetical protein [Sphingomonadales bacterium]